MGQDDGSGRTPADASDADVPDVRVVQADRAVREPAGLYAGSTSGIPARGLGLARGQVELRVGGQERCRAGREAGGMRPAARPGFARGGQRYEKSKEGPMKGFQPPPRFGGPQISHEPLPITKTITVTEGISVKDLAEKLDVRGKDLIAVRC